VECSNPSLDVYDSIISAMSNGSCLGFQDECTGGMSTEACYAGCDAAYALDVQWCNGGISPYARATCFADAAERMASCRAACAN
jgi:hypothetical protein